MRASPRSRASAPPVHVSSEWVTGDECLRSPYRGIETGQSILRLRVVIAPRGVAPHEVIVEVDDVAIEVREEDAAVVVGAGAVDALFVVERQPRHGFLTWFGVFARQRGHADRLLLETPEGRVARFVERAIEDRLGLADEPVRGELRVV
jgi:hypothetical protein